MVDKNGQGKAPEKLETPKNQKRGEKGHVAGHKLPKSALPQLLFHGQRSAAQGAPIFAMATAPGSKCSSTAQVFGKSSRTCKTCGCSVGNDQGLERPFGVIPSFPAENNSVNDPCPRFENEPRDFSGNQTGWIFRLNACLIPC